MKSNEKYILSDDAKEIFAFKSEKEEDEHETTMLSFKFLSEIEYLLDENKSIKKKDLARLLKTSPSYITQLFRGDKWVNLPTIQKLQKAFNITFEIKARKNNTSYGSVFNKGQAYEGMQTKNLFTVVHSQYRDIYTKEPLNYNLEEPEFIIDINTDSLIKNAVGI